MLMSIFGITMLNGNLKHTLQQAPATVPAALPGSGFINSTADVLKPDYRAIAALIYAENNLPSPYDPWYKKTSRACDYLLAEPNLCCSVFWCSEDAANEAEQLRSHYCDKDGSQLTFGKLPVNHRSDAVAIMQAVDEHTTDVLGSYFDYDEQSSALQMLADQLDKRFTDSSICCCMTVGILDPTKLTALLVPWCCAAGSTACLRRAAVVVDYM